ncbi:MAG: hypothetical protein K9M82_02565, partial [Deltaproteobacteria bacterium]|nr:hypothetical protein [Deltaproteobacteria bacterium]
FWGLAENGPLWSSSEASPQKQHPYHSVAVKMLVSAMGLGALTLIQTAIRGLVTNIILNPSGVHSI